MAAYGEGLKSIPHGPWPHVGTQSQDGVAIIGRKRIAFLLGGTNSYYEGYSRDGTEAANTWTSYCNRMFDVLAESNISFTFLVVPNKATCLPQFYPLDLGRGITDVFERIENVNSSWICSLLTDFKKKENSEAVFRRNDSHLTSYGSVLLCNSLVSHLGYEPAVDFNSFERKSILHDGDLGRRFTPFASEYFHQIKLPEHDVIVEAIHQPVNGFVGTSFCIENRDAIYNKTVVVFGNSFFERYNGWGATPYLCMYFRRIIFKWTNEIDIALIERYHVDHVVLQTCERFLRMPPASDTNA